MTYALIAACVVVYVLQLTVPGLTGRYDFTPYFGRTQPWRLLTATFLHDPGLLMHLLFNMFALWQVGQFLEPVLGRLRFLALYLISALGGSVMYLLLATPPTGPWEAPRSTWLIGTVGASGAVFGLFAALLVLARRLQVSLTGLYVVLGINLLLPFVYRNIAWQAHLGGFVVGLVVAGALIATRPPRRVRWQLPALAALVGVLVGLTAAKYATTKDDYLGIPRPAIPLAAALNSNDESSARPRPGPDLTAAGRPTSSPSGITRL